MHILVKSDSMITSLQELKKRKVILGATNSGTRQAALRLLQHFDVTQEDLEIIDGDWFSKEAREKADAMIVVVRPGLLGISEIISNEGSSYWMYLAQTMWLEKSIVFYHSRSPISIMSL